MEKLVFAHTSSNLSPNVSCVSLAMKPLYWSNFMGKDVHVSVCFLDKLHRDQKVQIGGNSVKTNRIVSDLHDFRGESALLTIRHTERGPFTTTD